jgi:biotin/methionine sulfoxide reductase
VNEPWWTATAKRADIVFPATTPYEREDIGRTNLDDYLFHMPQLIPPVGAARDDYAIFAGLAERLACRRTSPRAGARPTGSTCSMTNIARWPPNRGRGARPRDAQGAELGPTADPDEGPNRTLLRAVPRDPERAPLKTPSGRIEIFSETIDGFGYDDCPGHPVWLPPSEWLGTATAAAPLHLVSPQPGDKLHSQLESALADVEGARPETLVIHPDDARTRNIRSGDLLRVFNARGACRARAQVSRTSAPGVVALPTGAWFGEPGDNIDPHGNPNVLTRDAGTSRLGQGCSAHTALVEVKRLED